MRETKLTHLENWEIRTEDMPHKMEGYGYNKQQPA